ncbi:sensor kinase citA, dpiB [Vibrio ishigakensis]|uniref:histidine kinase n=1 Tax=Vibrio ishigakensis TaxID=1481914 RepID=A0A0B8P3H5_9VIBR|nr:sensor kinase citA, dpiB [Vibrio ishigakensis]
MLGNLIDNAFDASSSLESKPLPIKVSVSDLGNDLILEVTDSGRGLPNQIDVEQLFTLGVSSKTEKGHGIGLHLVKEIVERYQGSIEAENGPQYGAQFAVFIPKEGI